MNWYRVESGWYRLDKEGVCVAAVCDEVKFWSVYINEDLPPGDSQHKTLREAKAEAEKRIIDPKGK